MFRLLVWLITECLANLKVDQILCGVAQATKVRKHGVDVHELADRSEPRRLPAAGVTARNARGF